MTQLTPITTERVQAILAAYGADPARWPVAERVQCTAWLAAHPQDAAAWLAEAQAMDRLLDTLTVADLAHRASDQRMADTVIETLQLLGAVVLPFRAKTVKAPRRAASLIWATGIGLAACLAGATVGANLSLASMGDVRAQSVLEQVQLADTESDT